MSNDGFEDAHGSVSTLKMADCATNLTLLSTCSPDATSNIEDELDLMSIKYIRALRTVMFQLRSQTAFSDLVLLCSGNTSVMAHKAVLACSSAYLREQLSKASERARPYKLSVTDIDRSTAENLLEFVYTGRLNVPTRNYQAVSSTMLAAHKLHIDSLYFRCQTVLSATLSLTNVMAIWKLSEKCSDHKLRQDSVTLLAKQLESRYRTSRYLNLPFDQFRAVLSTAATLCFYSSDRLLHSTLAWVKHNRRERSDRFGELLACFRLSPSTDDLVTLPCPLSSPPHKPSSPIKMHTPMAVSVVKHQLPSPPKLMTSCPEVANTNTTTKVFLPLQLGHVSGDGAGDDISTTPSTATINEEEHPSLAGDSSSPTRSPTRLQEQPVPAREESPVAQASSISPIKLTLNPVLMLISIQQNDKLLIQYFVLGADQWLLSESELVFNIYTEAAIIVLNDVIYFCGGESKSYEKVATCTALDVTALRGYPVTPMRVAKAGAAATTLHQQIYCVGGESKYRKALSHVERYCPKQDSWKILAPLRKPRKNSVCEAIGDKVLALGGSDGNAWLLSCEMYSSAHNEWTEVGLMSTELGTSCLHTTTINDRIYIIRSARPRSLMWYDPEAGAWSGALPDHGQLPPKAMSAHSYGEQVYVVDDKRRVYVHYVHSRVWEKLEVPVGWPKASGLTFVCAFVVHRLPPLVQKEYDEFNKTQY